MILLRHEIEHGIRSGDIHFTGPMENIGPNSVDVTLHNKLLVYRNFPLRMDKPNKTKELTIPPEGLLLSPGTLYLGSTNEAATSRTFVPMYDGRSSVGRLGVFSHVTAGFGDVGFGYIMRRGPFFSSETPTNTPWTLEIVVVHPIVILPNIRIGQVYFHKPNSRPRFDDMYRGKYGRAKATKHGPQPSMIYKDKEIKELLKQQAQQTQAQQTQAQQTQAQQ